MKNDFQLFSDSGENGAGSDDEIALIAAYLSRELSTVQIAAVQERLANDAAFREKVQPLVEGWALPGTWDSTATRAAHDRAQRTTSLTRAEIEAGWKRAQSESGKTSDHAHTRTHTRSLTRIAATIAIIVLPLVVTAQLVVHVANTAGAPGHSFARGIVPQALLRGGQLDAAAPAPPDEQAIAYSDGPVQIQLSSGAQESQRVPVVDLSAPTARTQRLGIVMGIKELSDGRLLVNDPTSRELRVFAANLATSILALDSASGSARSYGNIYAAPMISWLGDSALIYPNLAQAEFRMVDGRGEVVRAIDPFFGHLGPSFGTASTQLASAGPSYVDPQGRFVYKGVRRDSSIRVPRNEALWAIACPPDICVSSSGAGRGGGGGDGMDGIYIPMRHDTLPIHRADLDSKRVDTIGFVLQPPNSVFRQLANGGGRVVVVYKDGKPSSVMQVINPLYTVDDWAVLSDGTIAIVRGQDYHVDWIHPDGRKTSSAKLPFEWKRLTDEDKQRVIDSTRARIDSLDRLAPWRMRIVSQASEVPGVSSYPTEFNFFLAHGGGERGLAALDSAKKANAGILPRVDSLARGLIPAPNASRRQNVTIGGRGVGPPQPADTLLIDIPSPRTIPYEIVPMSQIADYYPPIRVNSALADRDGNLWILPRQTTESRRGELVYDVVNPQRGFVRRVRLPVGRSIAGFGKNGVVYLQLGDIRNGFSIERTAVPKQ